MNFRKLEYPIAYIDYSILDDSDFREDSVREEIISPILSALGYKASGSNKVIRSKPLNHPFVSIGSKPFKSKIIPDYLLQVNGNFAWVLEAKGPNQKITGSAHVEQAYSYAINPEIRVPYFALCNGREFALYNISENKPILHFPIQELATVWADLCEHLAPNKISQQQTLAKDFGLHLKRRGGYDAKKLIFMDMPVAFIGQHGENKYRFSSVIPFEETHYLATFDFNSEQLNLLTTKLPEKLIKNFNTPFDNQVRRAHFSDGFVPLFSVDCSLGNDIIENDYEFYLPMVINKFL